MKLESRRNLPYKVAAFAMIGAIYGVFVYMNWSRLLPRGKVDLAVSIAAIFGSIITSLGSDLRNHRVVIVLGVLCACHSGFAVHFLAKGVYIRPLFYVPIGLLEVAISLLALLILGGARFKEFRAGSADRRN